MPNPRVFNRRPHGIQAVEYGDRFDEWTPDAGTGAGGWSRTNINLPDEQYVIEWDNGVGAAGGTAMFHMAYSELPFTDPSGYEDAHTVHVRATQESASNHWSIGPATCLTASSASGYAAAAYTTGLAIIKITGLGSLAVVASAAGVTLNMGDVLSLGYRYNTTADSADLSVLVNGTSQATYEDTSSPYRLSTLGGGSGGKVGLYGDPNETMVTGVTIGDTVREWWVTDGYQTFSEPLPFYPL